MEVKLLSVRKPKVAGLLQKELRDALAVEFGVIKLDLQAVKMEITYYYMKHHYAIIYYYIVKYMSPITEYG